MKKIIFLSAAVLLMSSCNFTSPKFQKLDAWRINRVSGSQIQLSNDAIFNNPNSFGGIKLGNLNLTVYADGKQIGTISNTPNSVYVGANSIFSVPFSLSINPADLVGSLGSLVSALSGQSINIRVQGGLVASYSVLSKNINIDFTQPISIKDIR